MRPWRVRLAFRRSRIQWILLSVVLAVSLLSSTLVGTLFLLTSSTEQFAARQALTDADADDVAVTRMIAPRNVPEAMAALEEADVAFWGDVPTTSTATVSSSLLDLPREDEDAGLTYLAVIDGIDDISTLRDGRWPQPTTGSLLEVAIPTSLVVELGLEVGDTVSTRPVFGRDITEFEVVGIYVPGTVDNQVWRLDKLDGRGYAERVVKPQTGGRVVTEGFGPMIMDLESYLSLDPRFTRTDTVTWTSVPDFSSLSLDHARTLVEDSGDMERSTLLAVADSGSNVRIISRLDVTLGGVLGSLAVTRSSVLVTGLLLLVLAVAALSQTARLMSERRHQETSLMVARGASGRQALHLSLIEAFVLGIITIVGGALGARYAYLALTQVDVLSAAGLRQDPGLGTALFIVTGIVGIILIVVLSAPLMKRQGTFIDSQQAHSRPSRRSVFQRSGLDLALVVLAALAYWQLRSYESPVITSGGVVRLDPLLAAGPALALLAGSLIAVRLIPAASRFMEALAARGRKAVMPLAAWEVGRRSARAVSAILLLTLAVSVGTFAVSYLSTWQQSQDHQSLYQHPQAAVVSGLTGPAYVQAQAFPADARVAPARELAVVVSTDTDTPLATLDELTGNEMRMVATTSDGLTAYNEGRLGTSFGSIIGPALSFADPVGEGIALPARSSGIQVDVAAWTSFTALERVSVALRVVIADPHNQLFTIDLGSIPVGKSSADGDYDYITLLGSLPAEYDGSDEGTGAPLRVVGIQTVWQSADDDVQPGVLTQQGLLELTLSFDRVASFDVVQVVPVTGQQPVTATTDLDIDLSQEWNTTSTRAAMQAKELDGDVIRMGGLAQPNPLRFRPVNITTSVTALAGNVPVVMTASAASSLRVEVGDPVRLSVEGTIVEAVVASVIPLLPHSTTRQDAIIVNSEHLNAALVQQGSFPVQPDRWWVLDHPDAAVESLPAHVTVTSREDISQALRNDPLRVATQAALWLVAAAAIILAAVGFAVHAIVTVRAREIEFAQLRAVGIKRGQLLRIVGAESLLLSVLGVVFGVGLGVALGYLVGPLVTVGADGRAPLPSVIVDVPWIAVGLLAVEIMAVLILTVGFVAAMLRKIDPAQLLRLGD